METIPENRAFGGVQGVYRHRFVATRGEMTFGLFLPAAAQGPVPVLWFLSGTCTHENAMVAARRQPGAFRMRAGYDHSYFFVASLMEDHVRFHAEAMGA